MNQIKICSYGVESHKKTPCSRWSLTKRLRKDIDNTLKQICYISLALTVAELKYSTTEKEALTLVWCIEK